MTQILGFPNTCQGALVDTLHAPCAAELGKALPSRTAGRDAPSLWLAAELLEETSRTLHRFGL